MDILCVFLWVVVVLVSIPALFAILYMVIDIYSMLFCVLFGTRNELSDSEREMRLITALKADLAAYESKVENNGK